MNSQSHVALSKIIQPGTIQLNLTGRDREEVLRELVKQIGEISKQPEAQETLLAALHEREKLHTTGIGDGIALPHARNALVGLVNDPVVVFGRHPTGIAYGALDGVPTRLFFLLVAPSVTQHLGILARLSRILRDPKVRQNLLSADKSEKVLDVLRDAEGKL